MEFFFLRNDSNFLNFLFLSGQSVRTKEEKEVLEHFAGVVSIYHLYKS